MCRRHWGHSVVTAGFVVALFLLMILAVATWAATQDVLMTDRMPIPSVRLLLGTTCSTKDRLVSFGVEKLFLQCIATYVNPNNTYKKRTYEDNSRPP